MYQRQQQRLQQQKRDFHGEDHPASSADWHHHHRLPLRPGLMPFQCSNTTRWHSRISSCHGPAAGRPRTISRNCKRPPRVSKVAPPSSLPRMKISNRPETFAGMDPFFRSCCCYLLFFVVTRAMAGGGGGVEEGRGHDDEEEDEEHKANEITASPARPLMEAAAARPNPSLLQPGSAHRTNEGPSPNRQFGISRRSRRFSLLRRCWRPVACLPKH